ncbi:hypothetical protein E1B28_000180 [Marasmius oreades]|uniref:Uncharacterized protein n=1 Tax=Marasmius oreades TaxID=181124 RepID=A0A9P7V0X7_9AGAR|nr:uncharacterized protein E1B28_000180 [Marasmius oreades]KAG7098212.1 hypothetical protein E1B28_000180 [Marasmius oreades]
MSAPSSTPNWTISTRRRSKPYRKRLTAILACSAISPTLDMFDFSMLHAQLSDTPKSSILAHCMSEEEFTSFEFIPLRKMNRGRDEPIPFFANATQNIDGTSSATGKRSTPVFTRSGSTESLSLISLGGPSAIDTRTITARPS